MSQNPEQLTKGWRRQLQHSQQLSWALKLKMSRTWVSARMPFLESAAEQALAAQFQLEHQEADEFLQNDRVARKVKTFGGGMGLGCWA